VEEQAQNLSKMTFKNFRTRNTPSTGTLKISKIQGNYQTRVS